MKKGENTLEDAIDDIDDIDIMSRDLETDELREKCKEIIKARHSVPRDEEIQRWAQPESTAAISRASQRPIEDVTKKVKKNLKTIMRKMGA